ncbi:MAG: sulfotransferase family protein [Actinomycetota bacterium]
MSEPIVVTGSHRSGTTWVGRMLAASGEAGYIHEPLNPVRRPNWSRYPVPFWYVYITETNEAELARSFSDLLRFRYPVAANLRRLRRIEHAGIFVTELARSVPLRVKQPRPLFKDPFALFSSEWLERRYGAGIVVMVRRPAAFIGSIKRLNWQFKFKTVLAQDLLMRDWLGPFEEDMRRCRDTDVDVIEQGIVLWNALHHVIARLRERHPGWSFVRHEDLAADPVPRFESLYEKLGLTWSEAVAREIASYSRGNNRKDVPTWRHGSVKRDSRAASETWKTRLTPGEIERIRSGTDAIAARFYSEAELD